MPNKNKVRHIKTEELHENENSKMYSGCKKNRYI